MHIYKYGFWFLLLLLITSINFIIRVDSKTNSNDSIKNSRLNSLVKSEKILGKPIEKMRVQNYETNQWIDLNVKDNTVVILLSKFGCQSCQIRELEGLSKLNTNLEIIPLLLEEEKGLAKMINAQSKLKQPIYLCSDSTFFNLSFENNFPQILFVKNNVVVSSFLPLAIDAEFSLEYYKELNYKIENY